MTLAAFRLSGAMGATTAVDPRAGAGGPVEAEEEVGTGKAASWGALPEALVHLHLGSACRQCLQ